jgi:hypothetical protein
LIPLLSYPSLYGSDTSSGPSKSPPGAVQPGEKEGSCGRFGTQVEFVDTPSEAARRAVKEQKLVFVLHVSGNFEDPRFT